MSSQSTVAGSQSSAAIGAGSYRFERPANVGDVTALIKRHNIQIVDLKFTDLPGLWQHFSITLPEIHEDLFSEGIGFDGSSIRGFQEIQESDMLLKPDPPTAFVDPFCEVPTLSIICDVFDPILQQPYSRDPRYVAKKAESHLKSTGVATTCYFGPELEFFIFDSIRFGQDQHCGYYYVESAEGEWNSGADEGAYRGGNLGYKPRYKEGYFPVPPHDTLQDIRSEIVLAAAHSKPAVAERCGKTAWQSSRADTRRARSPARCPGKQGQVHHPHDVGGGDVFAAAGNVADAGRPLHW